MTDRELLEFAAKAAVIDYYARAQSGGMLTDNGEWNPLTEDGDALRLAVRLNIDVMHTNIHSPKVHAMGNYDVACVEDASTDPYVATRRAIVRAAAEIGRSKNWKEQDMREKYEGQGLEWFFRILFALAAVGVIALVGGLVVGVWKWLT